MSTELGSKEQSHKWWMERAMRVLPGGVNSPVRAFRAVGGTPVFVESGDGPYIWGVDGKKYIDYVCSWGALIFGHAPPFVVEAVERAMRKGSSYGAPTPGEVEFAEMIAEIVPSVEMLRMTSSGTEAVMGAIRVARGYTGRDLVVKFEGCYHGGADYLLVQGGSGLATFGVPNSHGVPSKIAETTLVAPFNDLDAMKRIFEKHGRDIAAVIVEPVAGNMGVVPPEEGFLQGLREVTAAYGAILIFDEVMTGFRVALGGAQALYGVKPDLTCFGKVIGGGLPVGAFGGRRDIMEKLAPLGPVYQAGTLSGNPLAIAAGKATIEALKKPGVYERLEAQSCKIANGLEEAAQKNGVTDFCVQRVGSMLTPFFAKGPLRSWQDVSRADRSGFALWHRAMLEQGVHWPPSQFEAGFVSLSHDDAVFDATIRAAHAAFAALRK
ncbi:MAG: glutamate-1-semialdehyde 2,1-aminomutase [Sandaracinaceae bacterium]|nr:glutamate-1-semialdehyde 2,1-aminomutase [Sandaracinaceae bacterium]